MCRGGPFYKKEMGPTPLPNFFQTLPYSSSPVSRFFPIFVFLLTLPMAAPPPQVQWRRGDPCEISIPDPGFENSWYPAVHLSSFPKWGRNFVWYTTLLEDDWTTPLRELVPTNKIRPAPPHLPVQRYEAGDVVDAWTRDGWWKATVVRMLGQLVEVRFPVPAQGDELLYRVDQVRPHLKFNRQGQWVFP